MRIIRNNILPFKGFSAINLFGILFVRKNARLSEKTLNHERIHTAQIKEQLYAFFYLWYVIEWMIRLIRYRDSYKAYRNLSFEREAYANDDNLTYLENRKPFSFLKYL
jgi:hypothetical protein